MHARMHTRMHARTHTHTHNCFVALWTLSGTTRVSQYQKKHSLIPITVISHPLPAASIYYDPWHSPCSIYVPDSLSPDSTVSLQVFFGLPLGLAPQPYISSPNHCLLFAALAHTIKILVSLSTLYMELYLVVSRHTST